MKMLRHLAVAAVSILAISAISDDKAYEAELLEWHQKRIAGLKEESGWLNLAGFFWLKEGKNTFGADEANDMPFPAGKSQPFLGEILLDHDKITLKAKDGSEIYQGEKSVGELDIFPDGKAVTLSHKSLRWFVIKRGDKYAVRLKDLESEYLTGFKGIGRFPVQDKWRVRAKFEPTTGKTVSVTDVTGRTDEQPSPGRLVFTISGKPYTIDAVGTPEQLFLIFGDQTNKKETYGAGRFLYSAVEPDGTAWLDFNKAINPPCAFTPYATCPLPPKQNKLALAITAGEKRYGGH